MRVIIIIIIILIQFFVVSTGDIYTVYNFLYTVFEIFDTEEYCDLEI